MNCRNRDSGLATRIAFILACTIVTAACTSMPTEVPHESGLQLNTLGLPPIVAWRKPLTGQSYGTILATDPSGSYQSVMTLTVPANINSVHVGLEWMQKPNTLLAWFVLRPPGMLAGETRLLTQKAAILCRGRSVDGRRVLFDSQPVVDVNKTTVLVSVELQGITQGGGIVEMDFERCQGITHLERISIDKAWTVTSACLNSHLFTGNSRVTGESLLANLSGNKIADLGGTREAVLSPTCTELIGYRRDGWYVHKAPQWEQGTQIAVGDFSNAIDQGRDAEDQLIVTRPSWSPDGKFFVYSTYPAADKTNPTLVGSATSFILDMATGKERVLLTDAAYPAWQK